MNGGVICKVHGLSGLSKDSSFFVSDSKSIGRLNKTQLVYSRQGSRVVRNGNTIGGDSSLSCVPGSVTENCKVFEITTFNSRRCSTKKL